MKRCILIFVLFSCLALWANTPKPVYSIKLTWDEMSGELNGVLSGQIKGQNGFVQGVVKGANLGGLIQSSGETAIGGSQQNFTIHSNEGFFTFWIRDKFVDDDVNPDFSLIQKAEPRIDVFQGNRLLRSISINRGSGLTCKVFTLDAASGFVDQEVRFYPRTKMVVARVLNAVSGDPVSGAYLIVDGGDSRIAPQKSDAEGFALVALEIGNYKLNISKPGFIGTSYALRMGFDENPIEIVAAITPEIKEYRIVLTWGSRPADLDAHLSGPKPEGGSFHIWYRNRVMIGGRDFLDRDDTDGYGPETITIYKPASGEYLYSVHDYTNRQTNTSMALSRSGATVQVYAENRLLRSFTVPSEQVGTVWKVFKIDKNHNIVPIDTLTWIQNESNIR